jgi:hypothetical protein
MAAPVMIIISRTQWGARPPKQTPIYVAPSKRRYYVVHHSNGPVDQTVRAIQDWCMDGRGFNDIDYNFLVRGSTGQIYEGRGWDVQGAHTVGYNVTGVGVCIIGSDQCSDAAKLAVRWLYAQYNDRCGRTLAIRGHRDLDATDCPGDRNYAWVHAGMPAPIKEDDMPTVAEIVKGLLGADLGKAGGGDTVGVALQSGYQNSVKALDEIEALKAEVAEIRTLIIKAEAAQLRTLITPPTAPAPS